MLNDGLLHARTVLIGSIIWGFFFFGKKINYKYLLRELEILFGDSRFKHDHLLKEFD